MRLSERKLSMLKTFRARAFYQKESFFEKKMKIFFWSAKRLQSGFITLRRGNNYGELPKLVKGTHC